eukprot:217339_1
MATSHVFDLPDSSSPTIYLCMARKWLHPQHDPQTAQIHKTESGSTRSTLRASESQESDSNELSTECVTTSSNTPLVDGKSHLISALRWSNMDNTIKCTKSIKYAYHNCLLAASDPSNTLTSYDKIHLYALLISSGFIYYSECGNDYLNGLHKIYNILWNMNHEEQLQKDLIAALQCKVYWTDTERKLIQASIHFAVRTNLFIKDIQQHITDQIITNHNDDTKETDIELYLDVGWVPRYYDGYYFGNMNKNTSKYPTLSIKDLRNVMNADKTSYRIGIDDLVIHTHDLGQSGVYIEKHKEYTHHWLSATDWIDFDCVDKFRIYVQVVNNGRVYALQFNLYDTVKSVKHSISRKENVPMTMMRMEYNNQWL